MLKSSMLYPQDSVSRRAVRLDGMWKFQLDPNSSGIIEGWVDGLPDPDRIPVPASFCDFYTDKETREYCGDFWYETELYIPEEWKGKENFLFISYSAGMKSDFLNATAANVRKATGHLII